MQRRDSIHVKYDPMGNRVWKSATVDGVTTTHKFIVDMNSDLPTIVCITDASDPNLLISSYTYAGAQVLAQRRYPDPNVISSYDQQFYVHDRLGSVRLVVDTNDIDACIAVANSYTYTPFGSHYDGEAPAETVENPFKFTGQWHDAEINQYYLRARQYDPAMMRFTSRDPVRGKFTEPPSLHRYLYCHNNSVNYIDPSGKILGFADLLFTKSIEANLRKTDYKVHKKLLDRCEGSLDAFSLMNLQRGAAYDMLIADFDGGLKKSIRDGGVKALGLFSENLGRIVGFGVNIYDDRETIMGILVPFPLNKFHLY